MVEAAKAFNWAIKTPHVLRKCHKVTQCQCAVENRGTPYEPYNQCSHRRNKSHDGTEDAANARNFDFTLEEVFAARLKFTHFAVFLCKGFDHAHAGNGVGKERADGSPTPKQAAVGAMQAVTKFEGCNNQKGRGD